MEWDWLLLEAWLEKSQAAGDRRLLPVEVDVRTQWDDVRKTPSVLGRALEAAAGVSMGLVVSSCRIISVDPAQPQRMRQSQVGL